MNQPKRGRGVYKSLTIRRKLEIVNAVEKAPPTKTKKEIAAEFDIPPSTLSTIMKKKDSLKTMATHGSTKKKRNRDPSRTDVDEALYIWFSAARAQSVPLSGEMLKAKAEDLASELEPGVPWSCSNGWLSRWKKRHSITFRAICGENASVDLSVCAEWKELTLKPILQRYSAENIFNADETGLYWRLLPDKTHAVKGETCSGGKKSKERVTLLVCTNMTGTQKRPLLVIGKFQRPRCFSGVANLPTEYKGNKNAWMTSVVFEEWLRKWDNELTIQGRKIVLFVDNCSAHPHISCLQSIELVFLPPNTTSEIQPCDQGIINALKFHYRKNMVRKLMDCIDSGKKVEDFKITLLDALKMIREAWDKVTPMTIMNCFRKGGFSSTEEGEDTQEETEEDVAMVSLSDPCTFMEYAMIDEGLSVAPELSNEDIVALVRQDSAEVEDDDTGDPLPTVTSHQAFAAFKDIEAYILRHSKDSNRSYHVLRDLEILLTDTSSIACKQSLITDFF